MELSLQIKIETTPDTAAGETEAEGERVVEMVRERVTPLVESIIRDAAAEGMTVEMLEDSRES